MNTMGIVSVLTTLTGKYSKFPIGFGSIRSVRILRLIEAFVAFHRASCPPQAPSVFGMSRKEDPVRDDTFRTDSARWGEVQCLAR